MSRVGIAIIVFLLVIFVSHFVIIVVSGIFIRRSNRALKEAEKLLIETDMYFEQLNKIDLDTIEVNAEGEIIDPNKVNELETLLDKIKVNQAKITELFTITDKWGNLANSCMRLGLFALIKD